MSNAFELRNRASPPLRPSATRPVQPIAKPSPGRRYADALRSWWQTLWMDDCTTYLSRAVDCADLERRIRTWDEAERRDRMPMV